MLQDIWEVNASKVLVTEKKAKEIFEKVWATGVGCSLSKRTIEVTPEGARNYAEQAKLELVEV